MLPKILKIFLCSLSQDGTVSYCACRSILTMLLEQPWCFLLLAAFTMSNAVSWLTANSEVSLTTSNANCDWMPASYTSGQPSHPYRHPTCWASSQWSHTVSSTPCHLLHSGLTHPLSTNAQRLKSRHPFVPPTQQLISSSDNNNNMRRSGRITNGMWSGQKTPQDSAFSSPTSAPT